MAIARSIEDTFSRSSALVRIAQVAAADPGRAASLAAEAQTAARSIEDAGPRWHVLVGVAEMVAAADPEHAEAIADSIEDASSRSGAVADLARLLVQPDRYRLV